MFCHIIWLLIPLFLFHINIHLSAQHIPARHYTMRNGLPSMAIRCLFKDSRGLMWIGTDAGICSYDGKEFKILNTSEEITAGKIWSITEDSQGNLWFGSYGDGVYKYDGKSFIHLSMKSGIADDWTRVIYYSKTFNCIIAGAENGVTVIPGNLRSYSKHDFLIYKTAYRLTVTGIMETGKYIYIGGYNDKNPLRYYPGDRSFLATGDKNGQHPKNSFSCYISSKGDTIFSVNDGVVIVNKNSSIVRNDTTGQVFGISEDNKGNYWFAAWSYPERPYKGGIFCYDGKTWKNYKEAFRINDIEIWTVFFDKEQDLLWVGTLNEGIFMVPKPVFKEYDEKFFKLDNLKINHVYIDSKNSLWLSTKPNLIKKSPDDNFEIINNKLLLQACLFALKMNRNLKSQFLDYRFPEIRNKGEYKISNLLLRGALEYNAVFENIDHTFLLATSLGLYSYNEKSKKSQYYFDWINDDLAFWGSDTIIVVGWGPTAIFTDYKNQKLNKQNLPDTLFKPDRPPYDVSRIHRFRNQYWYASWKSGLWMSEGFKFINFNKIDSTISHDITDICTDSKGHVIFGSNTGEISIADYSSGKLNIICRINSQSGLQGNSISWLSCGPDGFLYAGTNLGINRIDLNALCRSKKLKVAIFDEEEGYNGQSSKRVAWDHSGNLWIAAADRLIKMLPQVAGDSVTLKDRILMTGMEINNKPASELSEICINPWTMVPMGITSLKHSENNLVFYFDCYNYLNPGKDFFRYRLIGYDKDWSNWLARRRAVYTNLPPGKYKFIVESYNKATNNDAVPLAFEFSIRHPWWGLWYVQVIAALLFIFSIYYYIHFKIDAIRNKEKHLRVTDKKIAQLEIQALQAQMNPHFIFNALNSLQYFVLSNKTDEVLAYLSDFSNIVRESLENVSRRMIPLNQSIEFVNSYLRIEKMRFPDKFDYQIIFDEEIDPVIFLIPPLLLQPFAENAIRHGFMYKNEKGYLEIDFGIMGSDILKCTFTDNGVGREKSAELQNTQFNKSRPHSTDIVNSRISLFNQPGEPLKYKVVYTDLYDNSVPSGLKVEIYLPFEYA